MYIYIYMCTFIHLYIYIDVYIYYINICYSLTELLKSTLRSTKVKVVKDTVNSTRLRRLSVTVKLEVAGQQNGSGSTGAAVEIPSYRVGLVGIHTYLANG